MGKIIVQSYALMLSAVISKRRNFREDIKWINAPCLFIEKTYLKTDSELKHFEILKMVHNFKKNFSTFDADVFGGVTDLPPLLPEISFI